MRANLTFLLHSCFQFYHWVILRSLGGDGWEVLSTQTEQDFGVGSKFKSTVMLLYNRLNTRVLTDGNCVDDTRKECRLSNYVSNVHAVKSLRKKIIICAASSGICHHWPNRLSLLV